MRKLRVADVASIVVLFGIVCQAAGLYVMVGSVGLSLVVVGSEIGALGLIGVINAR